MGWIHSRHAMRLVLVALIGMLVVQMFLFAALHHERAASLTSAAPPPDGALRAPPNPLLAAVPVLPPGAADPTPIVVVVIRGAPRDPAPEPSLTSNAMLDLPRAHRQTDAIPREEGVLT